MSTNPLSEFAPAAAPPPASGGWSTFLGGLHGIPPWLPDPAILAHMANEFFSAISAAQSPAAGAAVPAAPISPVSAPPAVPGASQPPAPDVPGAPGVVASGVPPKLSFLDDGRPRYPEAEKAGVLSFILDGVRTQEFGDLLNREGIAVRAGHHCAQPIHRRFGLESTVRASLAPYNTCSDIDALAAALLRIQTARPGRGV